MVLTKLLMGITIGFVIVLLSGAISKTSKQEIKYKKGVYKFQTVMGPNNNPVTFYEVVGSDGRIRITAITHNSSNVSVGN